MSFWELYSQKTDELSVQKRETCHFYMVSSTRDHLGYFESVGTESYFDQHIFLSIQRSQPEHKIALWP